MPTPTEIIDKMMAHDPFSQWLGVVRLGESQGYCQLQMTVRKEMLNGFGVVHGGITFAFADSCFAFASNSQGRHAVSIETSISHTRPAHEGDTLIATANEENLGHKTAIYTIKVENKATQKLIALFKGTVFRHDQQWILG